MWDPQVCGLCVNQALAENMYHSQIASLWMFNKMIICTDVAWCWEYRDTAHSGTSGWEELGKERLSNPTAGSYCRGLPWRRQDMSRVTVQLEVIREGRKGKNKYPNILSPCCPCWHKSTGHRVQGAHCTCMDWPPGPGKAQAGRRVLCSEPLHRPGVVKNLRSDCTT